MSNFTVEQAHQLPIAEAKARLDGFLQRMAANMGGSHKWTSDTEARIEHSLAKAAVKLEAARVVVRVDGGMALSLVKGKVEARIKAELQKALESPIAAV